MLHKQLSLADFKVTKTFLALAMAGIKKLKQNSFKSSMGFAIGAEGNKHIRSRIHAFWGNPALLLKQAGFSDHNEIYEKQDSDTWEALTNSWYIEAI